MGEVWLSRGLFFFPSQVLGFRDKDLGVGREGFGARSQRLRCRL